MTLTFKIQIRGIKKPPVWRRIEIPADFTFHNLHHVIQAAFGWMDYHLYTFEKVPFGSDWVVKVPDEYDNELDNPVMDSKRTNIQGFLSRMRISKLVYVYDYGDSWVHDVTLESINPERELPHPICLGGKGACPPEDCGGSYGYEEIKRLFDEEPDSEEAQEYREWLGLREGDVFDPNEFSLSQVNTRLSKIKRKAKKKKQESKKQAGPKPIRLYDTVNKLRKDEVIDNAEDLGLDIEPSLKVKAVKEQYAQQVLAHPREVLCQLPIQDLMIIQKLKEGTDGANIVDVYEDYFQPLLLPMGLAQEWRDGEVYYLHFGDDFRDAVTPLIDEVMDDLEVHARVTMESVIEGMANLYGVVNHVTVRKEMVRLGMAPSVEAADHLLKEVWQHSLLLKWIVTGSDILDNGPDSRSLYCSRFGWNDPFSLIDQLDSQGKGFRKFSEMEIVMASRNPMPVIPNPMQEKFEAMLADRLHLSEWETMQVCHDLWFFAMHEGDDEYKGCEPKRYFEDCVLNVLETEGQLRDEALRMVDDYLSHMPHWQLQGHAPADMEALPDRQQTQAGPVLPPTLPGGITPDPLWQAMPYFAPPKVGRNDPCPCGSGKKYKHCCGRGN